MKKVSMYCTGIFCLLMALTSCSSSNNYPSDYVGFEKSEISRTLNKDKATEEFSVKIIAAEKSDKDREVIVTVMNPPNKVLLTAEKSVVVIPAKKTSAMITLKAYPPRIDEGKKPNVRVNCKLKESTKSGSQLTIHLTKQ
ncbi:MAG: hypothetical protein LBL97_01115 [Prevotellaceae bacterium]|jgi:hypothetical protein|nr:hypothetical protein [Prevotellaceae bacterium]